MTLRMSARVAALDLPEPPETEWQGLITVNPCMEPAVPSEGVYVFPFCLVSLEMFREASQKGNWMHRK